MKILVTGATGMLGRAVMARFQQEKSWQVVGTAHRRLEPGYVAVDLADASSLVNMLATVQPDVIVHTAAIRKPDEFAADVEGARKLNVEATEALAQWAGAQSGRYLIYISSDYVFDGTAAPYAVTAPTHPINAYGISKRDGEEVVKAAASKSAGILRVPVLYGDVETLAESSVTNVVAQVLAVASEPRMLVLDDWATRYPTHVADVADILAQMVLHQSVGTFQWSGSEALTKLDMGRIVAQQLGVDLGLLSGSGAPANGSEPRPRDCHLLCDALENIGITTERTPFDVAIARILARNW